MVRRQRGEKNLLSVQELAAIMEDGIAFSKMNRPAALEKFTECITRSCQELMTALSISAFATNDGDRAQLLREADLLIEISKDCLDQSRFILQMAYDKTIKESTESAKLAETLSAEFLREGSAENATQYGLPHLALAKGLVLTQDNIVALKGLSAEQIEVINNHVRIHNEKMQSLAKKYKHEVCLSIDTEVSVEDITARFYGLRSEALAALQKRQQEIINKATKRFFRAQRRSLQVAAGTLVMLKSAKEEEEEEERSEEQSAREMRKREEEEKEELKRMTERVERLVCKSPFEDRLTSLKYELMQVKDMTTKVLTLRITEETKGLTRDVAVEFLRINEEGGEEVMVEGEGEGGEKTVKMVPIKVDMKLIERVCSDVVVSQLYPLIMTVFVQENNDMDTVACIKIDVLREEMTPRKAGIREAFWLTDNGDEKGVAEMYREAIACIKRLPEMDNVTKKFDCLRATFGLITGSVREFHRRRGTEGKAVLCSDDFISILCFVIVKSRLADCRAEVDFMSKFIPDVLCIGEEGFMLTTFMSCVELLTRISSSDLD